MFTHSESPPVSLAQQANYRQGIEQEQGGHFSVRGAIVAHPLAAYFAMAFGFPWLLWILLLDISADGLGLFNFHPPVDLVIVLGPFVGPTLAAFIATVALEGRPGLYRLLRRSVQWRTRPVWYLVAIFGFLASCLLAVSVLTPGAVEALPVALPQVLAWYLPALAVLFVISGPLGEEPGWRGFALPRLQTRLGPLAGSLLLGLVWALWHLPLFLVPQWRVSADLLGYVFGGLALSVIISWLYNNTGGSLLMTMLMHASELATAGFLTRFIPGIPIHSPLTYLAYSALALLVITATRGRLSYNVAAPDAPDMHAPVGLGTSE